MDVFITILMLAASLAAGITAGSRLARSNLDFLPSLYTHLFMFAALVLSCVYFAEHTRVLVGISCTLVSTSVFWLARKTAPEPVAPSTHLGYSAPATPNVKGKPAMTSFGNVISPTTWARPTFGKRRQPPPVRTTPTGKTIRLVASSDAIPRGKRGVAKLSSVK